MPDAALPRPSRSPRSAANRAPAGAVPTIDLALQGGGSHGAFTWGVLDALLEDGRLAFDGLSGTSAGAMNAAVMACGWARGGAKGARDALAAFWHDVSGARGFWGPGAASGPTLPGLPAQVFNLDQWPGYAAWQAWSRLWSPYDLNPLNVDSLRQLVARHVDVPVLRTGPLKVFVTATSVRTGQPRVFSGADLSVDALLASACLPQITKAVIIEGEAYWDGGYSGNPALWPLVYGTASDDVLLVQINPRVSEGVPHSSAEIADRVNEITFNAGLVAELRAIAFVQKLLKEDKLDPTRYKSLRLHRVADEAGLAPYDASSKLNTAPALLQALFKLGREAAARWLTSDLSAVGQHSSLDIESVYLAPRARS